MRLSTRCRVSSPISRLPRSTFETVTTDTPRSRAMSFSRIAIEVVSIIQTLSVAKRRRAAVLGKACSAPQHQAAGGHAGQQDDRERDNPTVIHSQWRDGGADAQPDENAGRGEQDQVVPPAAALVAAAEFISALRRVGALDVEVVALAFAHHRAVTGDLFAVRSDGCADGEGPKNPD